MIAPPGDPERSRLSVMCQNYAQIRYKGLLSYDVTESKADIRTEVVCGLAQMKMHKEVGTRFRLISIDVGRIPMLDVT